MYSINCIPFIARQNIVLHAVVTQFSQGNVVNEIRREHRGAVISSIVWGGW